MEELLPGIAPERLAEYPEGSGQMWIHDESLDLYENVGVGSVFRVMGKTGDIFFEIDARARRVAKAKKYLDNVWGSKEWKEVTEPEEMPGWWVHRVDPDQFDVDAFLEQVLGGGEA